MSKEMKTRDCAQRCISSSHRRWWSQRCPSKSKPSGALGDVQTNPNRVVRSAVSKPIQTEWFSQRCPSSSPGSVLSGVPTNPNQVVRSAVSLLLAGECAQRCLSSSHRRWCSVAVTSVTHSLGAGFLVKVVRVELCSPIQNLNGQDRFV